MTRTVDDTRAVEEVRIFAHWPENAMPDLGRRYSDLHTLALRHADKLDRLRAENERLRQELTERCESIDKLDARAIAAEAALEAEKKLSNAISRDCNATALERNELWAALALIARYQRKQIAMPERLKITIATGYGWRVT